MSVSATFYIFLNVEEKDRSYNMKNHEGHAILVSDRLPDFNGCQSIFIFVPYITGGVLSFYAVVKMRFDIGLHVVVYSNSSKAPPKFRYYLTRLSV